MRAGARRHGRYHFELTRDRETGRLSELSHSKLRSLTGQATVQKAVGFSEWCASRELEAAGSLRVSEARGASRQRDPEWLRVCTRVGECAHPAFSKTPSRCPPGTPHAQAARRLNLSGQPLSRTHQPGRVPAHCHALAGWRLDRALASSKRSGCISILTSCNSVAEWHPLATERAAIL